MTTKYVISGTRTFKDKDLFKAELMHLVGHKNSRNMEIISGGAQGADTLAEEFAKSFYIPFTKFEAQWDIQGKAAGPIRNAKMAEAGDRLIAFWDGESKGTADMILKMMEKRKPVTIIYI